MDLLENPMQAPCQCLFCNTCITEWLNNGNTNCPKDRKKLHLRELEPPRIIQALLNKLTIKCKNHKSGCKMQVSYSHLGQLVDHEKNNCGIKGATLRQENETLKNKIRELEEKIEARSKKILEYMEKEREHEDLAERMNALGQLNSSQANANSEAETIRFSLNVPSQSSSSSPRLFIDLPHDILRVCNLADYYGYTVF